MRRKSVLICGLGIAGATLARCLAGEGFTITVVERASTPRRDGYMIDLWGVGYDVAERMGLLPALRKVGYQIDDIRFVDGDGQQVGGFDGTALRGALGGRYLSVMRDDLSRTLSAGLGIWSNCRFGDSVVRIEAHADSVLVEFERSPPEFFDLVVGADGAHSTVRKLEFGEARHYQNYLGYVAAAFRCDGYEPRDEGAYVSYTEPGRQVARYSLRDGGSAFFLLFGARQPPDIAPDDRAAQRGLLLERFSRGGWESAAILEAMSRCDSFYFDAVNQVRMPSWSRGRVALVGDAAYSPSLLSGQGAAFGMAGAYILASELRRPGITHSMALANYEDALRPLIRPRQRLARRYGAWFAPNTRLGLSLRNRASRLFDRPAIARYALRADAKFVLPTAEFLA